MFYLCTLWPMYSKNSYHNFYRLFIGLELLEDTSWNRYDNLCRMWLFENFDRIVTGRGTYLKQSVFNMQYISQINQNHALYLGHFQLKFLIFTKFSMHSVPISVHSVHNFLCIDKKKWLGQRLLFDPEGSKMTISHLGEQKKFVLKKRI
jgi:hypothetical protein